MSILSFPNRGPWGKSSWRGNCSGFVYKDLFERIKPKFFIDPMMGSGTSIEVATEMQIACLGLDLHSGFNILRDSILNKAGKHADLVVSHPPYHDMIVYSGKGNVWGTEAHPDDLSRCASDADFNDKMQIALLNQRDATKVGGVYGTIIGDWRRQGKYTSYQAEMITRMRSEELLAVIIKQQHNTSSERKSYGKMALPFILHEYILLWERKGGTTFHLLSTIAKEQGARLRGTWRAVVRSVVMSLGGTSDLNAIYEKIAEGCDDKIRDNANWKAKVRQVLNSTGDFFSTERGIWSLV
jgi:hypothetical protein